MTKENPRKDFLPYLLHAKDSQTGKGFEKEELDTGSGLLITAGADTTSITLIAAFYLLENPRVLKKLTDEIREAFADVEEIRGGAKLNSLACLRTCIDETPRLAPPASTHLQDRCSRAWFSVRRSM
jgi:cytochrome P450